MFGSGMLNRHHKSYLWLVPEFQNLVPEFFSVGVCQSLDNLILHSFQPKIVVV